MFQNQLEYVVYGDSKQLGTITENVKKGDKIKLAGQTWEVTNIDKDKFKIYTKPSSGDAKFTWSSDTSANIDAKIINKIKEILNSEEEYNYLQPNAKELLIENRKKFQKLGLKEKMMISDKDNNKIILPFLGTKSLTTLSYILKNEKIDNNIININGIPLGIKITSLVLNNTIEKIIAKIIEDKIKIEDIKLENITLKNKYSEYIPDELKEKEFRYDYLDIEQLKKELKNVNKM